MSIKTETKRTETIIARVQSAKSATRVLEQLAVAGFYTAKRFNGSHIVYARHIFGFVEEITVKELGQRQFEVVKTTSPYPLDNIMEEKPEHQNSP